MASIDHLPLPYFEIDRSFQIRFISKEARDIFLPSEDITSLIEETDRNKFLKLVNLAQPSTKVEVNMKTKASPLSMFELIIHWQEDRAHILCYPLENRIQGLISQIQSLRNRLSETDFTLLENKEELEKTLHRVNRLSGPFISINVNTGLVPLFGDLAGDKVEAFKERIFNAVEDGRYHNILFDFSAVSSLNHEGVLAIQSLFQTLNLMGQQVIIVGVTPEQAMEMTRQKWFLDLNYMSSLSEALRLFM